MGNTCSGQRQQESTEIRVLNLNYCGIMSSPFEFYISEYEPQLKKIGNIFYQLCQAQLPQFTAITIAKDKRPQQFKHIQDSKDIFGELELYFKKNRYSPLFKKDAGIKKVSHENQFYDQYQIETEKQFIDKWNQSFEKEVKTNSKIKKLCAVYHQNNKLQTFKGNLRKYDFLVLKALLKYVYQKKQFEENLQGEVKLDRYIRILKPFFEFSFLDEENKLSQFKYGFIKTNPDLYFIHERSNYLVTFLEERARKNYIFKQNGEQLIIIKRDTFISEFCSSGEMKADPFNVVKVEDICKDQEPQIKNEKDKSINKIFIVESPNYLLLSVHLTSRQKVNVQQKKYLKKLLKQLKQKYSHKNIIVGGDLNSFEQFLSDGYDYYPKNEEEITTNKKRTALQAQIDKKDKTVKKSIDKIITNRNIQSGSIVMIDGTPPEEYQNYEQKKHHKEQNSKDKGLNSNIKVLLPTDAHPFDQFLLLTTIVVTLPLDRGNGQLPIHPISN